VLVTGASGFVGSHLVPTLVERGYDVYVLERYVTGRYILGSKRDITTVFADIRDFQATRQIVREVQPDKVVHLAAISAVSYSYEHPHEVNETNFFGTVNLAEACRREVTHFQHFLFAGTSEEYGNNGVIPETEDSQLKPNSPYSVSKVAADNYLKYMWDAYRFPVTILRPFNSYGRKDNTHFVVERTIRQALKENEIRLGDPRPVRDFLYINDHIDAYLASLEKPEKSIGETFNFCTGNGATIRELAELIVNLTDFKGEILWDSIPKRPLDIQKLIGDPSKALRVLGWEPRFTLEQGLKETVNYWEKQLG
jgi:nucleoside-diphosphate-sugar epimerase